MFPPVRHAWDLSPDDAIRLQIELRDLLVLTWEGLPVQRVAGVDVSVQGETARCAVVTLRFPSLQPIESVVAETPVVFPYLPGLLTFREGPAILAAWEKLRQPPDLVLFDGQGIAHPRRMGIASHMGLWLDIPSIGVAKSRLYGRHAELGPRRGQRAELYDAQGQVIGSVLRTRDHVKPLYISPGHRIDLDHAVDFVLACCRGYRLPEPTRWAHQVAGGGVFHPRGNPLPSLQPPLPFEE